MTNTFSATSFIDLFENANVYFFNSSVKSPVSSDIRARFLSDRRYVRVYDGSKYHIINDSNYKNYFGKDVYIDLPSGMDTALNKIMRSIFSTYRKINKMEPSDESRVAYISRIWSPYTQLVNNSLPFSKSQLSNYYNLIDLHVNVNKKTDWLDHKDLILSSEFKKFVSNFNRKSFAIATDNNKFVNEHIDFYAYLMAMYPFIYLYKKAPSSRINDKISVDGSPLYHAEYIELSSQSTGSYSSTWRSDSPQIRINDSEKEINYIRYSASDKDYLDENRLKLHGMYSYGYSIPSMLTVRGGTVKVGRWSIFNRYFVYNILKCMVDDLPDLSINDIIVLTPLIVYNSTTASPYKICRLLTCQAFKNRILELHEMVTTKNTISGRRLYDFDWNMYF